MSGITARKIPTRAELTRERILDVAENAFARHGLNGTRMREIAETA
jgi:AcrR family transcriptional regulator